MMEVTQQVNSVRRVVGTRVLEAGEARTVTISQRYHATLEEVWDACTNPERISRWFLPVSGDLRVGGRYHLLGNAEGTIEHCDPPRSFRATWEFGGGVTWIEVRFMAEPDGATVFELEHIAHVADELWDQFGPGAVGIGWDLSLHGLAKHLATGRSKSPDEGAAWAASAEGRKFIALSSSGWCDANIAAGAAVARARAAADRATAFFTGGGEDPNPGS
jgi:uncharacterized protein YndB with AHSA1/START domain